MIVQMPVNSDRSSLTRPAVLTAGVGLDAVNVSLHCLGGVDYTANTVDAAIYDLLA